MPIPQRILVIEDETVQRKALVQRLLKDGYQTLEATNGAEGTQVAFKEKPDLILLDLLMPQKDGEQVIRELKGDPWGKNVPIVVLSNYGDFSRIARVYNLGADLFIKSNSSLEEIMDKIKTRLLETRKL